MTIPWQRLEWSPQMLTFTAHSITLQGVAMVTFTSVGAFGVNALVLTSSIANITLIDI